VASHGDRAGGASWSWVRVWPAYSVASAFFVNVKTAAPSRRRWIGLGNTLEGLVGAYLIEPVCQRPPRVRERRDISDLRSATACSAQRERDHRRRDDPLRGRVRRLERTTVGIGSDLVFGDAVGCALSFSLFLLCILSNFVLLTDSRRLGPLLCSLSFLLVFPFLYSFFLLLLFFFLHYSLFIFSSSLSFSSFLFFHPLSSDF